MPLLLSVLRDTDGPDFRKLRVQAMECARLIEFFVFTSFVFCFVISSLLLVDCKKTSYRCWSECF